MKSIRKYYEEMGIDKYYENNAENYKNPHKQDIEEIVSELLKTINIGSEICDLCCGSGEISLCLKEKNIIGIDPYTYSIYEKNTSNKCLKYSFKDIAKGAILNYEFDTIICSFALHLCEESLLPIVLWQLSQISKRLIIITPHKRPNCNNVFGWKSVYKIKINKVTAIVYEKGSP